MRRPTDLLLSDYAGHAFTYELAESLNGRDLRVAYSYCSTNVSPKGSLKGSLTVYPVSSGASFDKYHLGRRLLAEVRYGFGAALTVWKTRPSIHVVANMPLVSLLVIWLLTAPRRPRLMIWFQDVQSGLAAGILGESLLPRILSNLESFLLRRARRVIAISPELADESVRRGVRPDDVGVVENWAPIEHLPVRPRANDWAAKHGLVDSMVFLYSGTLARKHNPMMLVDLARAVGAMGAVVVVVSEGEGAVLLDEQRHGNADLANLLVLPYQPFEELPDLLASADVMLLLLEEHAGAFSVPSKTLSYLCAGRPIVAAMPLENAAATMVADRAQAGIVVSPGDSAGFCAAALHLAVDPDRRQRLGASGRAFADTHFAEEAVAELMLKQFRLAGLALPA